ncbi:MAG: U2 snRNP complex subunit [Vezdaea aestivalis]|nr:MAG: U2 snRNP complex subunit [Vezdaea aestivalis]
MAELADLDPLSGFPKLTHVVLMDNPVVRRENYRYWVIWRCPGIRFLDYQKVKLVEKEKATELFGTAEEPTALASKIMGIKSKTFEVGASDASAVNGGKNYRVKLTERERKRVEELIKNAKSLQEIAKLEKELNEGRIPGGALADTMEE